MNEIKPGTLCVIIKSDQHPHDVDRIVEALTAPALLAAGGSPPRVNMGVIVTADWLPYHWKWGRQVIIRAAYLRPISGPGIDAAETTGRDIPVSRQL